MAFQDLTQAVSRIRRRAGNSPSQIMIVYVFDSAAKGLVKEGCTTNMFAKHTSLLNNNHQICRLFINIKPTMEDLNANL